MVEIDKINQKIKLKELNGLSTQKEDAAIIGAAVEYIEQHQDDEVFQSALLAIDDGVIDEDWMRDYDTEYCKEDGEKLKAQYAMLGDEAMRESILKEFYALSDKEEYINFMYYTRRFIAFGPNDKKLLSIIDGHRFDFLNDDDYSNPEHPAMPTGLMGTE